MRKFPLWETGETYDLSEDECHWHTLQISCKRFICEQDERRWSGRYENLLELTWGIP